MSKIIENFKDPSKPGFFSIGGVPLQISVEDISLSRIQNDDEVMTLRAKYPMVVKTGFTRLDASVSWKALVTTDSAGNPDFSQYEDLRRIVAMFRSAPFVHIENEHVKSFVGGDIPLAFALKDMTIQSSPDIVDSLEVTLNMTLFNYLPYSPDFAYRNAQGERVAVEQSDIFKNYVDSWMTENLDKGAKEFSIPNWKTQKSDTTLYYRKFQNVSPPTPTPTDGNPPPVPNDAPTFFKDNGYIYDHFTNQDGFIFHEEVIPLGFDSFGSSTVTVGVSVQLSNNLAIIPLSDYQYPTYQHIGPAVTNVVLNFMVTDPDNDSVIKDITTMMSTINDQFRKFRTKARKVESIFGMQAVFVQNLVLNMLGITAINPKQINTQTLEDSTMIQGQILGIQYENYFEDLPGFKVTAPVASYNEAVQVLADPKVLGNLNAQDKQVVAPLQAFYDAKTAHDTSFFLKHGFDTTTAGASLIESMPSISLPSTVLTSDQQAGIKVLGELIAAQAKQNGAPLDTISSHSTAGGTLTYTDCINIFTLSDKYYHQYLVGTADPTNTGFNNGRNAIASWAASQPTHPMDAMFDQLFTSMAQQDPLFAKAIQSATASPQYKNAIHNSVVTPGTDPYNVGHGAYTDLGLKTLLFNGEDFNPAVYYYDYNKQLYALIASDMTNRVKDVLQPTVALNNQTNPEANQITSSDQSILQYSKLTGLSQGDPSGLLQRTNVPGTTMAEAFPTFKLFLYEEDNNTIFHAFDNFYSYASVSEIEVIKYQDKPDAARVVLTNLAGLLTHRLFDNSADGKREYSYEAAPSTPLASDGSALTDPTGNSKIVAYKDPRGFNQMSGINGKTVPLKYYALQTGSKIQIRMGYSNNPDKLWPVFTGQITEMSERGDILEFEAQSFMLELMQPNDDTLKSNGWSLPGVVGDSVFAAATVIPNLTERLFAGHPLSAAGGVVADLWNTINVFKKTKAYTGSAIFGVSGEADNVIKDMLKASNARHFGRWQVLQGGDPLAKGFRWNDLGKSLLSKGSTNGLDTFTDSFINTLYDRSGENILINNYINVDGTTSADTGFNKTRRSWAFERPLYLPAQYSIPEADNRRPTWDFIKDVSRRYPEYALVVKPYGFPFGADATLVFAHPNDWYRSRGTVVGEAEAMMANDKTESTPFFSWWQSYGRAKFLKTIAPIAKHNSVYNDPNLGFFSRTVDTDKIVAQIDNTKSYEFFTAYVSRVADTVASNNKGAITLGQFNLLPGFVSDQHDYVGEANAVLSYLRAAQDAVQQQLSGSFLQTTPDKSIKPVRQYHFVDSHTIIHNGMAVNNKIFNTVKVGDDTYCANEFIPHQHRRLLDCNPLIVDPEFNVGSAIAVSIRKSVAASFLKEEVSKMYQGEIILRGIPSIEPNDVLMIQDVTTGVVGPVEVDSVVHSFDQDMGFVTIVRPRLMILINEVFTLNSLASLLVSYSQASAQIRSLGTEWDESYRSAKVEVGLLGASVGILGVAAVTIFGWAGVAAATLVGLGLLTFLANTTELTPILVCPVRKFTNPWLGGLEGYRIGDGIQHLGSVIKNFNFDNISPLIESYYTAKDFISPTIRGVGGVTPISTGPSTGSVSANGLNILKGFEGIRLNTYLDSGGRATIGYGHLLKPGESYPNGISLDQASALLVQDLGTASNAVRTYVKVPITQNQFDALVSFTYNLGAGVLKSSTLLKLLNASDFASVPDQLLRFNKVNGAISKDLVKRRQAEANLFES